MPIAFERVSYTYADPKSLRKSAKNKAEQDPSKRAKWGNAPDEVWALRDISFQLERGEFFGIAGHTGSGKSTLIQHMNGLLHPTSGRVTFDGEDLADKKAAAHVRGRCGLVFQYPEHQLFAPTVYEDVAFGPRNMGLGTEEVDARVRRALDWVGLDFEEVHEKSPFALSGGQQRRVAFAGVLAMDPEVLVLDEPAAGLDPHARRELLAFVKSLHARGLTVVMVSHSMEDLANLCDRVLLLNAGRQFMLGTPVEVFADPAQLKSIGLGAPAAQAMAVRLRAQGFKLERPLYRNELELAEDLRGELS